MRGVSGAVIMSRDVILTLDVHTGQYLQVPCHYSVCTLDSNFHWPSDLIIQILYTCTNMYYVHLIGQERTMPLKFSHARNPGK